MKEDKKEFCTAKVTFPVTKKVLFDAWLNGEQHSLMTGGQAICQPIVGFKFSAWDGYITGENIEIIKYSKIVQSWRTSEFSDTDEDSTLTLKFEDLEKGCAMELIHQNIPDGQTQYKQGWEEHYFAPMKAYFENLSAI